MRKNKRMKVVMLDRTLCLWRVTLKDGRDAEILARSKKGAAEQAGGLWGIPAEWVRRCAKIVKL